MFVDLNFVDDEFSRDFTLPFLQNLPFADIFSDAAKGRQKENVDWKPKRIQAPSTSSCQMTIKTRDRTQSLPKKWYLFVGSVPGRQIEDFGGQFGFD